MYDLVIKRGDTRSCIKAVLINSDGDPTDLAGCEVRYHMVALNRFNVLNRTIHIENAEKGEVWMVWQPGDTDVAGVYRAEFEVTHPDGRRETYPNSGYISIQILEDLG